MKPYLLKVEKPWGYELIFTPPDSPVVAKLLHINQGCRFSLQYHEVKEENLILIKGKTEIYWGNNKDTLEVEEMVLNHGYLIKPKVIHRISAVTDCDIFESSTKEAGKTVRIEDDYKRGDETEEERLNARIIISK